MALISFLREHKVSVLDGGFATAVEACGVRLDDKLWSAGLLTQKRHDVITRVHLDFLEAGANIITTCTYQASFEGFLAQGYTRDASVLFFKDGFVCADRARSLFLSTQASAHPTPLIAGSLGPYGGALADGSEYTGDYPGVTCEALVAFHLPRAEVVACSGVDFLLFETVPSAKEVEALTKVAQHIANHPSIPNLDIVVSLSCKDASNIADGSPVASAVSILGGCDAITAVGFNCFPPSYATALVKTAASITSKPIFVYPNSGEGFEVEGAGWVGERQSGFGACAVEWVKAGASVVGGCCRVRPCDVQEMAEALRGERGQGDEMVEREGGRGEGVKEGRVAVVASAL